jgi:predicted tellurium resistance membrane protein TerC
LSFLLLIGFTLIVEGLHQHIPKGYIYFAMGFSVLVEMLNLRVRGTARAPVNLREPYAQAMAGGVAAEVVNVPARAPEKRKTSRKKKK